MEVLLNDIEKQLESNNLTEQELSELNGDKKAVEDMLTKISGNDELIDKLIEDIEDYSEDSVKLTDKDAIEQIIKDIDTLLETENLTEEEKKAFDIDYPKVSEYEKEEKLAYEKEVLGIYATGHPLENYQSMLQKNIDATTSDFLIDPETESAAVVDQLYYTLGGMVAAKTVIMTKINQDMAFITLEDTVGTLEIVVFSRAYEKYRQYLEVDSKIFVYGRASISEKESKLILDKLVPFSEVPKQVYIQFANKEEYQAQERKLYDLIDNYAGNDKVTVVLKEEKMMKKKLIHGLLSLTLAASVFVTGISFFVSCFIGCSFFIVCF